MVLLSQKRIFQASFSKGFVNLPGLDTCGYDR